MTDALRMARSAVHALVAAAALGCGAAPTAMNDLRTAALDASAQSAITIRDTVQQLSATVALTNHGTEPVHLEYGACPVRLLAYREQADALPVWNSDYRAPYHANYTYGCTLQLIAGDLQPGRTLTFAFTAPLIELVGDSLPNGRYYLAADLLLSSGLRFQRIPAGAVDVAISHGPS